MLNRVLRCPGIARALALRPRLRQVLFGPVTGDADSLSTALAAEIIPRLASPGFADAVASGAQMANVVDVRDIATRTLLIWGAVDPILPVDGARELARQMPDARLVVFDGVRTLPDVRVPGKVQHSARGVRHRRLDGHLR